MIEKEQKLIQGLLAGKEPKQAAEQAGYKIHTQRDLKRLLEKKNVRQAVGRQEEMTLRERMKATLERIAFGPVEGIMRFMDGSQETVTGDLLPVSELKCRQGSYEVKFYDRLRAMEMLERLEAAGLQESGEENLAQVLEESAKVMRGNEEG